MNLKMKYPTIPTFLPTYPDAKNIFIEQVTSNQRGEFNALNRHINHSFSFENVGAAREIGLDSLLIPDEIQQKTPYQHLIKEVLTENLTPNDYFTLAEPHVSKMLISPKNFSNIKKIAGYFPSGVTDFLGFEVRLNGEESQADWAFAISGRGNARYTLANYLNNGHFPPSFRTTKEWNRILNFTKLWTEPNSILHDKILGAWLEFDMPENPPAVYIPSVFFNPAHIKGSSIGDPSEYDWFTKIAIPSLLGNRMSQQIEQNLYSALQKMPKNASLFIVGIMLSRNTSNIRMSVQFCDPEQIMPYLHELGWSEKNETFTSLINDLITLNANRIVLDFDVGRSIGQTIAAECSFSPNNYHQEQHWKNLLDYLVEKSIVAPEKRDDLLCFPGSETTVMLPDMKTKSYEKDLTSSNTIVRYITHIKIQYTPEEQRLKAKAYLAIRKFGRNNICI